jgi:hypothetical protein
MSFTSIPLAAAQSTQSPSFTIQSYPFFANTHIAVDLNGDGILDLAGPAQNSAAVMLGNPDGTFQARVNFPAAGQTQDLAADDFNGDAKLDLAVTINTPNAILPWNQVITFSWNPVAGASTYQVHIDDSSSFSSPFVLNRTRLTQTQTAHTFTSERTFWWRVRGRTASGANGAWSTVRSFVIRQLAAPTPTRTPAPTAKQTLPTATSPSATPASTLPPTPTRTTTAIPSPAPSRTPTTVAADMVSIQRAEYSAGSAELRVEATGSNASATLTVYVTSTNTRVGTLRNEGGGRYRGEFSWPSNPQNITVRSSFGGSASRTVTLK